MLDQRLCDGCGHAIAFYDDAGTPVLMSHVDMHKHHADEPYIGCFLCRDKFVSRESIAAVLNDPQTLEAMARADHRERGLRDSCYDAADGIDNPPTSWDDLSEGDRIDLRDFAHASLDALISVFQGAGLTTTDEEKPDVET